MTIGFSADAMVGHGYEINLPAIYPILSPMVKFWKSESYRPTCPSLVEICIQTLLINHHGQDASQHDDTALSHPHLQPFTEVLGSGNYDLLGHFGARRQDIQRWYGEVCGGSIGDDDDDDDDKVRQVRLLV